MMTALKKIILFSLVLWQSSLFAQGNIASVTPAVGNLSTTVTLQISGTNTVFTQATSILRHSIDNTVLEASSVSIINDSTMSAEYIIPNDPFLVGWYDVHADAAAPLASGFYVEPNGVVFKGNVYNDMDANCFFDPTESGYYNGHFYVKAQPGNIFAAVTIDGEYAVELPLGTYNATLELIYYPWWNPNYNNQMLCDTMYTIPINAATPQIITGVDFGISFTHVRGTVWIDGNTDCNIDPTEQLVSYGYAKLANPSTTRWAAIQSDGTYDFTLPVANFTGTLSFVQPYDYYGYSWHDVICPAANTYPITITGNNSTLIANKNFGLTTLDTCPKIKSDIQMGIVRPCFLNNTSVFVTNITPNTAQNVETTITLDPNINLISTSYAANLSNITGNVLTFTFSSLAPFESKHIIIHDSISCSAVLGQYAVSSVNSAFTPTACNDSVWGYDVHHRMFTLSYDPNNKETASHIYDEIAANEALEYVINFQNTGTDTAFSVTLLDTLPPQLIPSSIVPIGSSHDFTYHLVAPNVVKFLFHNINLPDSNVNEPASKGFIKFSIDQTPNNPLGTIIKNKAAIYFDFNDPIITNFTHNIIPLVTFSEGDLDGGDVRVMPNPFSDATRFVFTNKSKNSTATIQLFDITGKLVDEITNISANTYEYKNVKLVDQMYFYKVFDQEKQLGVGKLMIKK